MDRKEPQETMPNQDNSSGQTFKPFSADQKYQIEKKIAEGGMGMILSVLDKNMQRQVAMKVISADQSESQDHISRFIEEVQITGQLEHPNIVPTYELGAGVDGKVYYTMKLVKGKTLDDILEKLKARNRSLPRSDIPCLNYCRYLSRYATVSHSRTARALSTATLSRKISWSVSSARCL